MCVLTCSLLQYTFIWVMKHLPHWKSFWLHFLRLLCIVVWDKQWSGNRRLSQRIKNKLLKHGNMTYQTNYCGRSGKTASIAWLPVNMLMARQLAWHTIWLWVFLRSYLMNYICFQKEIWTKSNIHQTERTVFLRASSVQIFQVFLIQFQNGEFFYWRRMRGT